MAKDINSIFFNITPEIEELALKCEKNNAIEKELYTKYEVKRGLRDSAGKGVLTGLTEISDVTGYKLVNGRRIFRMYVHQRSWMVYPFHAKETCIIEVIISRIWSKVSLMQSTRDMKRPHIYFCSENFRIKKSWLTFRR